MLNWNEVRDRAIRFSRTWSEARDEEPDKQTFWNAFFDIFGIPRRSVATFEHAIARAKGTHGFIDLFWPGVLLVEHKSRGASFSKAESQAFAYLNDLVRQGHHDAVPRYVVLCDFARFALYDLEPDDTRDLPLLDDGSPYRLVEIPLANLYRHIREFAFIKGEKPLRLDPEDPANLKATQLLAELHDALEDTGYCGHPLERYLVRLLFCFFAEDTGIFEPAAFASLITRSRSDGSDLGPLLSQLWEVLDLSSEQRQTTLDEDLASFPYVNGGLFSEKLPTCSFNTALREALLACTRFHWARISPAVFGSLFQGVLEPRQRRQLGAHYTSERDIIKLLRGLFLDELQTELEAAKADRSTGRVARLRSFQKQLRSLRFFDPACGCGNFLILSYREVRRLENETLVAIHTINGKLQTELEVRHIALVDVDQFYGLEIGEWPTRIAEVGLWLTDHQCNVELAEALGQTYRRLPLSATPTIRVSNALRTDWKSFLPPDQNVRVLGNPPFVGHHYQSSEQKEDQQIVMGDIPACGVLDYVSNWYVKAAEYVQGNPETRCAFVSTNSITQGEQAGILWTPLFSKYHLKINFAHRTFPWMSEARGKAHVHVVIIGFSTGNVDEKKLYDYPADQDEVSVTRVSNISPYLVEGPDRAVTNRSTPISAAPKMSWGNKPTDGGHLILSPEERESLLKGEPQAAPLIRRYMSGGDFIKGEERYCLWLKDADPVLLRSCPTILSRIEQVRQFRLASSAETTRRYADQPTLFRQIAQPNSDYLAIPEVSSERRRYIPIAFLSGEIICSNKIQFVPAATPWHFGILTSSMHMAWTRLVCGRLKSDISYSNTLVYNNFVWPVEADHLRRLDVENAAKSVLSARAQFPEATLADLYDPLAMPTTLVKAHADLDSAVDRCYRQKVFKTDRERVEHLFSLYEQYEAPLIPTVPFAGRRRSRSTRSIGDSGAMAEQKPTPWYEEARELMLNGLSDDGTDLLADKIEAMLSAGEIENCNRALGAIVRSEARYPIDALVSILSFTQSAGSNLPNRLKLLASTKERLIRLGRDADNILKRF